MAKEQMNEIVQLRNTVGNMSMSIINFQTKIVDLITDTDRRKSAELASLVTSAMTDADKHHQRELTSKIPNT